MIHYIGKIKLKPAPEKEGWLGQDRVYCPFCGISQYAAGIRMHMASLAMREPFYKLTGVIKQAKHFDFYMKNTVQIRNKRAWKN